jgi:tetratricopeptide (TPR) repeat protein
MNPLVHPDTFHLNAARGWLGLGDPASASAELENITPKCLAHPDVLLVRSEIYHHSKKWDALVAVSETLVKTLPEASEGWVNRSFALHELKRTQEAYDLLLPAVAKFPKHWLIPYNLACYTAQLGKLKDSSTFLQTAFALGDAKRLRLMALDDPDLKPIWAHVSEI